MPRPHHLSVLATGCVAALAVYEFRTLEPRRTSAAAPAAEVAAPDRPSAPPPALPAARRRGEPPPAASGAAPPASGHAQPAPRPDAADAAILAEAQAAVDAGRPDEARDLLAAVLARRPDAAWAHERLGQLLMDKYDDLEGAEQSFRQAVILSPDASAAARRELVDLATETDRGPDLRAFLADLMKQHPDSVGLAQAAGELAFADGQLERATQLLGRAAAAPGGAEALGELALARATAGDLSQAMDDYRQAEAARADELAQGGQDAEEDLVALAGELASAMMDRGDWVKAREILDEATYRFPDAETLADLAAGLDDQKSH